MEPNDLALRAFEHALRAENKSDKTVSSYLESARALAGFLHGADLLAATPDDIRRFIGWQLEHRSASTAAIRYRSLQQLYRWAVADELIERSPMERLRPPTIPEQPVPIVAETELRRLLKACEGRGFLERRDTALIRLMLEPGGLRRSEVIGLTVTSVDIEDASVIVLGKGRRPRAVPYSHKTGRALLAYLTVRSRHPYAARTDVLWLAQKGPLTGNGLAQMLERRCAQAGIDRIKPHQLRHTAADRWLAESGGDETSVMRLFGWRSRQMLQRYGASNADQRAQAAARRLSLGDRL